MNHVSIAIVIGVGLSSALLLACSDPDLVTVDGGDGGSSIGPSLCGDGSVEPGESCDGSDLAGASCKTLGFPGGRLRCTSECTFDTSDCFQEEICDNGIDDDGDGAIDCEDPDCQGSPVCPRCGDGVVDSQEQCDGTDLSGETCASQGFEWGELGCLPDCRFDHSWCRRSEICDNAADDDGDGLVDCEDPDCIEASHCRTCGNGVLDESEDCEGGNLDDQSCESLGFDFGVLACTSSCLFDTSGCGRFENCENGIDDDGDGLVDCEDPDCSKETHCPVCGNALLQDGETCEVGFLPTCSDLGFDGGTSACDSSCSLDATGCRFFECGDGIVDGTERCDDGNSDFGDGCTPECHIEGDVCEAPMPLAWSPVDGEWVWASSLSNFFPDYSGRCSDTDGMADAVASFTAPAAGVYYIHVDAEFDAVLFLWRDSCGSPTPDVCTDRVRQAFSEATEVPLDSGEVVHIVVAESTLAPTSNGGTFRLAVGRPTCGDGILQGLEQCDDGNQVGGDGCDDTCRWEGNGCLDAYDLNLNGYYSDMVQLPFPIPQRYRRFTNEVWTWYADTEQFDHFTSGTGTAFSKSEFALFPCGGLGPEGVARFVAPRTGEFKVAAESDFPATLYVREGCNGDQLTCSPFLTLLEVPGNYWLTAMSDSVELTQGQEIFLFVDGRNAGDKGRFWLTVMPLAVCGDGIITGPEDCDDGNVFNGDGCNSNCTLELQMSGSKNPNAPADFGSGPIQADIFTDSSSHYWSFKATQGTTYRIKTSDSFALDGVCKSTIDTSLRILDLSGNELAFTDDVAPGVTCSSLAWTAPATGTYVVEVTLDSHPALPWGPYAYKDSVNLFLHIAPEA